MPRSDLTIYERILQDILDGHVPPGRFVHETELASRYGVSRTPIREALGALEYARIIERERGGIRVTEPKPAEIFQIYDVKAALEAEAAREAALNRTDVDLSMLSTLFEATKVAQEEGRDDIATLNNRLHHTLREASHNRILVEMLDRLDINLSRFRMSTMVHPGRPEVALRQHQDLVEAVRVGDTNAAMVIARQHTYDARVIRLAQYGAGLAGAGSPATASNGS